MNVEASLYPEQERSSYQRRLLDLLKRDDIAPLIEQAKDFPPSAFEDRRVLKVAAEKVKKFIEGDYTQYNDEDAGYDDYYEYRTREADELLLIFPSLQKDDLLRDWVKQNVFARFSSEINEIGEGIVHLIGDEGFADPERLQEIATWFDGHVYGSSWKFPVGPLIRFVPHTEARDKAVRVSVAEPLKNGSITALGLVRNYFSEIPIKDPEIRVFAEQGFRENLTNAYYKAIDEFASALGFSPESFAEKEYFLAFAEGFRWWLEVSKEKRDELPLCVPKEAIARAAEHVAIEAIQEEDNALFQRALPYAPAEFKTRTDVKHFIENPPLGEGWTEEDEHVEAKEVEEQAESSEIAALRNALMEDDFYDLSELTAACPADVLEKGEIFEAAKVVAKRFLKPHYRDYDHGDDTVVNTLYEAERILAAFPRLREDGELRGLAIDALQRLILEDHSVKSVGESVVKLVGEEALRSVSLRQQLSALIDAQEMHPDPASEDYENIPMRLVSPIIAFAEHTPERDAKIREFLLKDIENDDTVGIQLARNYFGSDILHDTVVRHAVIRAFHRINARGEFFTANKYAEAVGFTEEEILASSGNIVSGLLVFDEGNYGKPSLPKFLSKEALEKLAREAIADAEKHGEQFAINRIERVVFGAKRVVFGKDWSKSSWYGSQDSEPVSSQNFVTADPNNLLFLAKRLPAEVLNDSEVLATAKKRALNLLVEEVQEGGWSDPHSEAAGLLGIFSALKDDVEIKAAGKAAVLSALERGLPKAPALSDSLGNAVEVAQSPEGVHATKAYLLKQLQTSGFAVFDHPLFSRVDFQDKELVQHAKTACLDILGRGYYKSVAEFSEKFGIAQADLPPKQLLDAAKMCMLVVVTDWNISAAKEVAEQFHIPKDFYTSHAFVSTLEKAFFQAAIAGNGSSVHTLLGVESALHLPMGMVKATAQDAARDLLTVPHYEYEQQARALIDKLGTPEFLEKPDIAVLLKKAPAVAPTAPPVTQLPKGPSPSSGWGHAARAEQLEKEFQTLAPKDQMIRRVVNGRMQEALVIAKNNNISPQEFFAMLVEDADARQEMDKYEEQLVTFYRFNELDALLESTGREFPLDPSKVVKVLGDLFKDGMPVVARECLRVIEKHGMAVDSKTNLRERILLAAAEEDLRRENRTPREVSRSRDVPNVAHRMAALFYGEVRVLQNIDLLMQNLKPGGIEFSFSTNLRLNEIRNDLRAEVHTVSERLQQYILVAVHSEMRHQDQLQDRQFDVRLPNAEWHDAKELFKNGTVEECITYLSKARARFTQNGWSSSYGGRKWASIAEAGEALFRDPTDVVLIDHIFDLEHNTQAIFDKDKSLIEQDADKMSALKTGKILDAKRNARGNTRSLVRIMREVMPSTDEAKTFDRLDRLVDRWVDILRSVERTYIANGKIFKYEQYI